MSERPVADQIEVARCAYCGNQISRVKAPREPWHHNTGGKGHRPSPVPSSVRDLLSR